VFTAYGSAAVNGVGEDLEGDEPVRFWTSVALKLDCAQESTDNPTKMQILIQSGMEPEVLFL